MSWAVAAVGTAYSIYAGERNYDDAKDALKGGGGAPETAGQLTYDEFGNLISEVVFNEETGNYESRIDPEPRPPASSEPPIPDDFMPFKPSAGTSLSLRYGYRGGAQRTLADEKTDWKAERDAAWLESPERAEILQNDPEYQDYLEKHTTWQTRYDAKVADRDLRDSMKQTLLGNLSETPEDRLLAYEEYAKTFSDELHKGVDERFDKQERSRSEDLNRRGMFGSRAYVDTISEIDKNRKEADVDISRQATLAKHDLASRDKAEWLGTLSYLDAGGRADLAQNLNQSSASTQAAIGGTALLQNAKNQNTSNALALSQLNNQRTANISNTAAGLAFLYGYGGGGNDSSSTVNINDIYASAAR